ncbi:hypothetical protein DFR67_102275 [Williamsia limnetica]|uniref:Transcriptional regulator, AbiEi antitoxin, Type IV TA system n=1 Tax=Williamsia limnetica TaxID=882452 RepID=A0A318S0Y3_WILLI|nr:hypothetical protein [Williamsia limnetica]PYE20137.1 hypothetical protein DFR67_102275 [Williamsia limnetica]
MEGLVEDSDGLVWRKVLLSVGFVDADIARSVRAGRLLKVWPGVYVDTTVKRTPDELRRLRVVAAARSCSQPFVIGYQSAGLIHSIPLLKPDHTKVHLISGRIGGGRLESKRHIHGFVLSEGETCDVGGMAVTSVARTAVDVARSGTFDQALTAFDSALRMGCNLPEMNDVLESMRGKHGLQTAQRALVAADRLSETVGESWSRAQMLACSDIPVPVLQCRFFDEGGRFVARPDFEWEGRLAGEFDGLVKYGGGSMTPGLTPSDVVIAEKIREDRLRQMGVEVVRWVWADLQAGRLPSILRRALARAGLI